LLLLDNFHSGIFADYRIVRLTNPDGIKKIKEKIYRIYIYTNQEARIFEKHPQFSKIKYKNHTKEINIFIFLKNNYLEKKQKNSNINFLIFLFFYFF